MQATMDWQSYLKDAELKHEDCACADKPMPDNWRYVRYEIGGSQIQIRVQCLDCMALCGTALKRVDHPDYLKYYFLSKAEYKKRAEDEASARINAKTAWWSRYSEYLKSPEWKARRDLVIQRCNGRCEGCGIMPVEHVHHLTYSHVGAEFLFELRGLCEKCHDRIHGIEEGWA